jgi:hypothetical protein
MAHAAVVEVSLDPASDAEHRHEILETFVVPEVQALPGFVRAVFLNDGRGTGTCVVVCSNEEAARAAQDVLTREGGPPVLRAGLYEVEAEA